MSRYQILHQHNLLIAFIAYKKNDCDANTSIIVYENDSCKEFRKSELISEKFGEDKKVAI